MMGEAASLPLPAAAPAPTAAALAATATTATAAGTAAQVVAAPPVGNPGLLFDLLLSEQPEAAALSLAGTLPTAPHAAAGERTEEPPAADPLLSVLAQMPQSPQVAVLPVAPTIPPAPTNAPAATAAASEPLIGLAASQPNAGPGLAGADIAMPAPAAPPAAGLPADKTPDAGLPTPHGARFPPSPPGLANQPAGPDTPLPGFVRPAAELAVAPSEAAAPVAATPIHALQPLAGVQPASTPAVPLAAPVLTQPADPANGYDDGFSGHVTWLAGQRIGQAEIRVVPDHLGAIDIRLQLDGSHVRAEFHSPQAEVRQALEASLPRLREMLGQHGLQLAHAGVGQGQSGQRQSGDGAPQPGHAGGLTLPDDAGSPLPPDFRRTRGLLDVYA